MSHKTIAALLCSFVFASAVMAADSQAVEEATQKMNAGQHREALKSIAQSLGNLKRDDESSERYQLLMLKGECLIQINSLPIAASAFDAAANAATGPKELATARATTLLIRASGQGKYRPKTASAEPIDIVNVETRKQAFAALREDLANGLKPKLTKASGSETLTPMFDVLPPLLDLGYLEFAADGSAPKTREQLQELGVRARALMTAEIRKMRIRMGAMENVMHSQWDGDTRGLNSDERKQLREAVEYIRRIEKTARDVRRRAIELGFDGEVWAPIIADAGDLAERAQAVSDFNP